MRQGDRRFTIAQGLTKPLRPRLVDVLPPGATQVCLSHVGARQLEFHCWPEWHRRGPLNCLRWSTSARRLPTAALSISRTLLPVLSIIHAFIPSPPTTSTPHPVLVSTCRAASTTLRVTSTAEACMTTMRPISSSPLFWLEAGHSVAAHRGHGSHACGRLRSGTGCLQPSCLLLLVLVPASSTTAPPRCKCTSDVCKFSGSKQNLLTRCCNGTGGACKFPRANAFEFLS